MTSKELFDLQHKTFRECIDILKKKNSDYAGLDSDALANFKRASMLNVEPPRGVLVRLSDKISRLVSFIDKGSFKVDDEAVADTVQDAINYLVIFNALYIDHENQSRKESQEASEEGKH